jgi:hypothetical protein
MGLELCKLLLQWAAIHCSQLEHLHQDLVHYKQELGQSKLQQALSKLEQEQSRLVEGVEEHMLGQLVLVRKMVENRRQQVPVVIHTHQLPLLVVYSWVQEDHNLVLEVRS